MKAMGFLASGTNAEAFQRLRAITEPMLNIDRYRWKSSWSNLIKDRENEVDGEQHN